MDILIVEDNKLIAEMMREMIATLGNSGTLVTTGQQAISITSQIKFDLILLDVNLPDIDGVEVARFIFKNSRYKRPIIAAVTGNTSAQIHDTCLNAGIMEVLTKPFTFNEISALMKRVKLRLRQT